MDFSCAEEDCFVWLGDAAVEPAKEKSEKKMWKGAEKELRGTG